MDLEEWELLPDHGFLEAGKKVVLPAALAKAASLSVLAADQKDPAVSQTRYPSAATTTEAKIAGTNAAASADGPGAGASTSAAAFWAAIITAITTTTKKAFIFNASIFCI
ncbi:haloacid dehalogenase-like hydrolase superfamily protein [Striga asiatica]|uniref:Haloacid dehalogenase-like hydrolase superfamily protein n=1 Tax=Striga asiatica TaxID=4170 RepID=A0A5A7Q4V5_STRAF|nr:haloacid dehalogenase-like hydrolase superfamily protein [Striga asiatica]